jgi:hypothetical protein
MQSSRRKPFWLAGWKQISATLVIGELNQAGLDAKLTEARATQAQIDSLESQLTNLRNQRDALHLTIWNQVKRVRAGVKANFGDDSSQFEMVGGTRLSERKPPVRKAKTAA